MRNNWVPLGVVCVGLLAACSGQAAKAPAGDIAKVTAVKSSFGPEFKVKEFPPTGIDPKLLAAQRLPAGLTFDPADCAGFATGQTMPKDLQGNMSAVAAEGDGNRFIAIAMQTSKEIPFNDPGDKCKKVSFTGGPLRGTAEAIPAPQIDGVQTQAVHRVLQTTINGKEQSGEVFSYLAHFGDYQVVVTANPLVVPNQPVAPVDTQRAEKLLTDAVAAVRG